MRYFQISNGNHGCMWDYSTAHPCNSIDDLADALFNEYNDTAEAHDTKPIFKVDAQRWAIQVWHSKGYLPISVDVGPGTYCVAANPCTAQEAKEINDACY